MLRLTDGADRPADTANIKRPSRLPARSLRVPLLPAGIALGLAVIAVLEVDGVLEFIGDAGEVARRLIPHLGPAASVLAIYLEESGVPLPLPGDVFVLYVGHVAASSPVGLVLAWICLVTAVVAGSSNLYLVSRHWGRRLVEGPFGALLHLTPERLAIAERAFNRWGVLALIFGRHILGLRVPLTVVAGVLRVPYRVFAASVAISSAVWAAIWLALGVRFGARVAGFLHFHRWAYVAIPLAFWIIVVAYALVQRWRPPHRSLEKPFPT